MTIKGRLQVSMPNVKAILGRKFVPSKTSPKIAGFGDKRGFRLILVLQSQKGTSLHGIASFDVFSVKNSKSMQASWL